MDPWTHSFSTWETFLYTAIMENNAFKMLIVKKFRSTFYFLLLEDNLPGANMLTSQTRHNLVLTVPEVNVLEQILISVV